MRKNDFQLFQVTSHFKGTFIDYPLVEKNPINDDLVRYTGQFRPIPNKAIFDLSSFIV